MAEYGARPIPCEQQGHMSVKTSKVRREWKHNLFHTVHQLIDANKMHNTR